MEAGAVTKQVDFTVVAPADTMALTEPPVMILDGDELVLDRAPLIEPAPDTLTIWLQEVRFETDDDLVEVENGESADEVYGPDEPLGDWAWEAIAGMLPLPVPNMPRAYSIAYRAEKAGYADLTFRSSAVLVKRFTILNGSDFRVSATPSPIEDGSVIDADDTDVITSLPETGRVIRMFRVKADGSEVEILPPAPPTVQTIARVGSWAGAAADTVAIPTSAESGIAFVVASGVGLVVPPNWTIFGDYTASAGPRRMVAAAKVMAPGEQIGTWANANRIIGGLYTGAAVAFDAQGNLQFQTAVLTGSQPNTTYPAFPASGALPDDSVILCLQASIGPASGVTLDFVTHPDLTTQIIEQSKNRVGAMEGAATALVERVTGVRLDPGLIVLLGLTPAAGA